MEFYFSRIFFKKVEHSQPTKLYMLFLSKKTVEMCYINPFFYPSGTEGICSTQSWQQQNPANSKALSVCVTLRQKHVQSCLLGSISPEPA